MAKNRANNSALVTLVFASATILAVLGIAIGPKFNSCIKDKGDIFACFNIVINSYISDVLNEFSELKSNSEEAKTQQPVVDVSPDFSVFPSDLVQVEADQNVEVEKNIKIIEEKPADEKFQELIVPDVKEAPEVVEVTPEAKNILQPVADEVEMSQEVILPTSIEINERIKTPKEIIPLENKSEEIVSQEVVIELQTLQDKPELQESLQQKPLQQELRLQEPLQQEPLQQEPRLQEIVQGDKAQDRVKNNFETSDSIEIITTDVQPYLSIDEIKIDKEKKFISGRGEEGLTVQLLIDDNLIGQSKVIDGHWKINLGEIDVDTDLLVLPSQKIRIDFLKNGTKAVFASADIDFINDNIELDDNRLVQCCADNIIIVKKGDNLWDIAKKYYGSGYRYRIISDANSRQIDNPKWIYPGQILQLPPREGQ